MHVPLMPCSLTRVLRDTRHLVGRQPNLLTYIFRNTIIFSQLKLCAYSLKLDWTCATS